MITNFQMIMTMTLSLFINLLAPSAWGLECQDIPRLLIASLDQRLAAQATPRSLQQSPLPIEALLLSKSLRNLWTLHQNAPLNQYVVSLGRIPVGAKYRSGDLRTPEGWYSIVEKKTDSAYNKGLLLSYPEEKDIMKAKKLRVNPGDSIFIHGFPVNISERRRAEEVHKTTRDWTQGCIAVRDPEIEELFEVVPIGTPILICP